MLEPTVDNPTSDDDSVYPSIEGDAINEGQPKVYNYATEADPLSLAEELSLELFLLTKSLGVSRDGHDMISKFVNKALQMAATQSFHDSNQTDCPNRACNGTRYKDPNALIKIPSMSIKILSLSDMLASKIRNGVTRKQLLYRHHHDQIGNQSGTLDDIFNGSVYQQLKATRFNNPLDTAIGLYIDGFQPFERSTQSHTMAQVINLNLHPNERFLLHNMFQVCITPGRRKQFHLDSFLKPLLDESKTLEEQGIEVNETYRLCLTYRATRGTAATLGAGSVK
ncbi:hypothetical protein [Absidia glauca]|uniref:Uncharacterized protein n=1 Tax=Absidia glauca TaxID=4829 RepID=A0A163J3F8_ABSGL|nr:hypothetical protein [Absidia glauca]